MTIARRTYSRRYQSMQAQLESKYVATVHRALRKQVGSFTSMIRQQGAHAAKASISTHLLNNHIAPVIRRLYLDAGLERARMIRTELRIERDRQKRAGFGTNDEMTHSIIDYLQRFIMDKVVRPVSETTRDWVLRMLERGITAGRGAADIANEIEGSDFTRNQAIRIVRTETVRATNIGGMKAAQFAPFVVEKMWISAHDNRVRHSHVRMDGTFADFDQPFGNGLMQPGDPNGSAAETINCRCTVAFMPKRDERGRLIMKPPGVQPVIMPMNQPIKRPGLLRRVLNFLNTG